MRRALKTGWKRRGPLWVGYRTRMTAAYPSTKSASAAWAVQR